MDDSFKQYSKRIDYLISQGYSEGEALKLVRDDIPISDELWFQLVNAFTGWELPDREGVRVRRRALMKRFGTFVDEVERGDLSEATRAEFYKAAEEYQRLVGERKLWDELTEQQQEQVRERFGAEQNLAADQYSYELDDDGNVIARWPRPSLRG